MAFDPAVMKNMGVNVDTFGDMNAFGDPAWYQAYNNPGYYTETHKAFRALCRKITDEEITPNCHEWDEAGVIPQEVYKHLGQKGVLPIGVGRPWPKKYIGKCPLGFEPDYFHELIMFDELSRCGSGGFLWGIAGGLVIGLPPVLHWAQEDVKQRVVPAVLNSEKVICLAITEPTAGSDVGAIRTSAVRDGEYYVVNGEKKWITNGVFADFFTVAVRTGSKEDGPKGISLLLVEKTMPGVTTRKMKCSGVWSSGTTYITFEDVKVPVGNLIGTENKGFKIIMSNFNHERFAICAMTNRFSRVCMEEALKFASKRKTFGKTLIQHDVIRWKLAEMARLIESTHAWMESVTYQLNTMHRMEATMKLGGITALLKVQCTKVFEYCAREAAQIFGGLSYTRGGQGEKVERLSREVRAMAVPGGSEEVMLDLGMRQSKKIADMAKTILDANPDLKAKL
eukprot:TRINITY_DN55078_c0_g1_i1.p1 TRINITY_DN55078_c0_g1~~TRINITY_DN55078_c0_g1_i1.p1  ORF type:complete len:470 (+),score=54.26 TRINITY_DN55078_c0_g1_i1:56-1411(+)